MFHRTVELFLLLFMQLGIIMKSQQKPMWLSTNQKVLQTVFQLNVKTVKARMGVHKFLVHHRPHQTMQGRSSIKSLAVASRIKTERTIL